MTLILQRHLTAKLKNFVMRAKGIETTILIRLVSTLRKKRTFVTCQYPTVILHKQAMKDHYSKCI